MSQIAERAGNGRATLYEYFPDLDAVLSAWHERQVGRHLEQLRAASHAAGSDPGRRLEAVLRAYAAFSGQHDGSPPAASPHHGKHVGQPQARLRAFVGDLLADGVRSGRLRDDVPAAELAQYALAALSTAAGLPDDAARERLIIVILTGLRPTR
jgi:AcrR family transcriptional regulator